MLQRPVLQTISPQLRLSLNIENLDHLFPGFTPGDFAVLHGSSVIKFLSSLLCVRAQLPYQLGGLETNTVFVDGSNSFRLYEVSTIAQSHELDPKEALERIFISRAFTAYQLTSLVLEKLQDGIKQYDSKLVILSNLAQLYLDKDVPKREAKEIFMQLTTHLLNFTTKNRVITIVTHSPRFHSKRSRFFTEVLHGRANVLISVRNSKQGPQLVLEKHPQFKLGKAEWPSEDFTLMDFMDA
jgi:hypothetical protein